MSKLQEFIFIIFSFVFAYLITDFILNPPDWFVDFLREEFLK